MARNYVYFMHNPENGHIKIGQSIHPDKRMKQIRRDVGADLEIMATLEDEPLERILHKRFDQHRLYGEWFYPAVEILTFIEEHEGRADKPTLQQKLGEFKEMVDDIIEEEKESEGEDVWYMAYIFGIPLVLLAFGGALYELMRAGVNSVYKFVAVLESPTQENVWIFFDQFFWVVMIILAPFIIKQFIRWITLQRQAEGATDTRIVTTD